MGYTLIIQVRGACHSTYLLLRCALDAVQLQARAPNADDRHRLRGAGAGFRHGVVGGYGPRPRVQPRCPQRAGQRPRQAPCQPSGAAAPGLP